MIFIIIYLAIILVVIEINVILFKMTGLEHQVARFQVISMLTGTGFTTGESELIIEHPVRRTLGAFLILFGAFSLAVIISAISTLLSDNFFSYNIAYVAGGLFIVLFILKAPLIQRKLSDKLQKEMVHHYKISDLPVRDVILTSDDDEICELSIERDSDFIGKSFDELLDDNDDIMVLFIKRGEIKIRRERLTTEIQAGDEAVLYGDSTSIENKFPNNLIRHYPAGRQS